MTRKRLKNTIMQIVLAIFLITSPVIANADKLTIIKSALNFKRVTTSVDSGLSAHSITIKNTQFSTLKYGSKEENIQRLMHLGRKDRGLTITEELAYSSRFKDIDNGDFILLSCLKRAECDLENAAIITKNKSELHHHVYIRTIPSNVQQLNQAVGQVTEDLMHASYKTSGWNRLDSIVRGNKGIDGLYIKRNKDGVIKDVLIGESKYGGSQLGDTQHGKQMSKNWIQNNVKELIKAYPENKDYPIVLRHVQNGNYRGQLFNLSISDNKMTINARNVYSKGSDVAIEDVVGSYNTNQTFSSNRVIDLASPTNNYHKQMVASLQDSLNRLSVTNLH